MRNYLFGILFILFTQLANAQTMVFIGTPNLKILESGLERSLEKIEKSKELTVACVVREVDGKFYWESRGNKQLLKIDNGTFVIYSAIDGSGYIRVIKPSMKNSVSVMSSTEANFDYVEHLLLGLRSVTYYGKIKSSNF